MCIGWWSVAPRLPSRSRTRSPVLHTSGAVEGNTLPLMVRTLKSVISKGFGRAVPAFTDHSLIISEKSRSTRYSGGGFRGWMTNIPIRPIPIWVISSWCEWNMKVPCCRSVHSYFAVSPALMYGCVRAADAIHAVGKIDAVPVDRRRHRQPVRHIHADPFALDRFDD